MSFKTYAIVTALIGVLLGAAILPLHAQTRINDKDMQALMQNLQQDAKSFQPVFDNALKQSTIRKTSQEKDARNLAAHFTKQTGGMLDHFKKKKKADDDLSAVLASAVQIDGLVNNLKLNSQAVAQWQNVRNGLHAVAVAYGHPDPLSAPPQN